MNKQEVMAKVALTEKDTGSPEVQVALLTAHINELNEHLNLGGASVLLGQSDFGHNFLLVHSNSTSL